jgi:hypothetical protein
VSSTRQELRRLVGDVTGDLLLIRATSTTNTTTIADTVRLADRGDRAPSIVNRILYFGADADTANLAHEAAVTDFTSSTRTITFTPAAPTAPTSGKYAELWSVAERIGSISAIHRLINYAIEQVKDMAGLEEYSTPAVTFDARTGTVAIPATWAEVGGAEWTDSSGYARELPSRWLRVRPAGRLVEIHGKGAGLANRKSVRLWGYPRMTALTTDAGTTDVDAAWIVNSVAQALTLAPSWRSSDPAAAERRANFWATQAQVYKREIMAPRRGLHVALP